MNKISKVDNIFTGSHTDSFLTFARWEDVNHGSLFNNTFFYESDDPATKRVISSPNEVVNLTRSFKPQHFVIVPEDHEAELVVDSLDWLNTHATNRKSEYFLARFDISYSLEQVVVSNESPYGDYKRWKALQKLEETEIAALGLLDIFVVLKLKFG